MSDLMVSRDNITGTYDAASDVLYLHQRRGVAARGLEDEYGVVWRYDADGSLLGITIIDFRELWPEHASVIESRISQGFHVSPDRVSRLVSKIVRSQP